MTDSAILCASDDGNKQDLDKEMYLQRIRVSESADHVDLATSIVLTCQPRLFVKSKVQRLSVIDQHAFNCPHPS